MFESCDILQLILCSSANLSKYLLVVLCFKQRQNETCKESLFNFTCFVNVLAILSQFFFALIIYQTQNFNLMSRIQEAQILPQMFFEHLIFTFTLYFSWTFIGLFILFQLLIHFALNSLFSFLLTVLFNNPTT